jgi:hypothetical protein
MIMAERQAFAPLGWCAPHLASGTYENATTSFSGTSMCTAHAQANMAAAAASSTSTSTQTGTGAGLVIKL